MMYRVYVTDMLKGLVEAEHRLRGSNIEIPRYYDLENKKSQKKEKTAEEIISNVSDVLEKLGAKH